MKYYLISPKVDGISTSAFLKEMYSQKIVMMGWKPNDPIGQSFNKIKRGDFIIVAQRQDWKFHYYFAGIIADDSSFVVDGIQCRNLANFVDLRQDSSIDYLKDISFHDMQVIKALMEIDFYKNSHIIKKLNKIIQMQIKKELSDLLKSKKNLILQGAPGTGKTYNTAVIALSLLGEDVNSFQNHNKLMDKYDEYRNNGQIDFCTFHQSMDYEDFIEGIKPIVKDNQVTYDVQSGIFKRMCLRAKTNTNFSEAYSKLIEDLQKEDDILTLKTKTGKTFGIKLNSKGNLTLCTGENFQQNGTLTKDQLESWFLGENEYLYWSGYYTGVVEYLKDKFGLSTDNKEKKYVLIIDEINRGNISKIFGELITLLEADKRLGGEHPITLTLPYSKERFGVPSNLYIIGTMNTTDRSVGSVDYAIRRRFAFVTVYSDMSIVKDYYTNDALREQAVNLYNAVEKYINANKLDLDMEDLMVGHSYFMTDDLDRAWKYEILPLLTEYYKDGLLKKAPKAQTYVEFVKQQEK